VPALKNARHERFAQELASGKCQADAYEAAGYAPSEPNASRLTRNDKVSARVAEIQGKAAARVVLTIDDIAKQLDEDRAFARQSGSAAAAVAATMGKAKVLGLIVDKSDLSSSDGSMSPKPTIIEFVAPDASDD